MSYFDSWYKFIASFSLNKSDDILNENKQKLADYILFNMFIKWFKIHYRETRYICFTFSTKLTKLMHHPEIIIYWTVPAICDRICKQPLISQLSTSGRTNFRVQNTVLGHPKIGVWFVLFCMRCPLLIILWNANLTVFIFSHHHFSLLLFHVVDHASVLFQLILLCFCINSSLLLLKKII